MERSKALQTKAKRVQHHQASFTKNVEGTSLSEKEKATTRNMKIKTHREKEMKIKTERKR